MLRAWGQLLGMGSDVSLVDQQPASVSNQIILFLCQKSFIGNHPYHSLCFPMGADRALHCICPRSSQFPFRSVALFLELLGN